MDLALCTIDGKTYNSIDFSRLSSSEIAKLRQSLVCKECHCHAFYRKRSSDGKRACFGSDHFETCLMYAAKRNSKRNKEAATLVNKIIASNEIVTIDFDLQGAAKETKSPGLDNNNEPSTQPGQRKSHKLDPESEKISSLKLASILRLLIESPMFSNSEILINTGATYPFKAKNLFVNCKDVQMPRLEKMNGQTWRGYWGMIRSCSNDWMTSGDTFWRTDKLNPAVLSAFMKKNKTKDFEDLAGFHFLLFGTLKKSAKEKLYIDVDVRTPIVFL